MWNNSRKPRNRSNLISLYPTFLPGMLWWFDASDTSTITSSANKVSVWTAKNNPGITLTQATASSQPTTGVDTQNGLNVLTFNGTSAMFYNASAYIPSSGITTMAAVFKLTDNSLVFRSIYSARGSVATDKLWLTKTSSSTLVGGGVDGATTLSRQEFFNDIASFHVAIFTFDGSSNDSVVTTSMILDSSNVTTETSSPPLNNGLASSASVGANITSGLVASNFWQGYLCELIAYSGPLSTYKVYALSNYLKNKWSTL